MNLRAVPPVRHLEAAYSPDGRVERLVLSLIEPGDGAHVAYIVTIEPNDDTPYPTEWSVKRRTFAGPSITDLREDVIARSDPDIGSRTDALAWRAIEVAIKTDELPPDTYIQRKGRLA